jgi:hypothetical protein
VLGGKLYLNYSQDVRKGWLPRAGRIHPGGGCALAEAGRGVAAETDTA